MQTMKSWSRLQDWLSLILGVWTFATPWIFGAPIGGTACWVAWVLGAAVALVALYTLASPESGAAEWTQVVVAIVLFASPWLFGFTNLGGFSWSAWIVAVVIAAASLWARSEIGAEGGTPAHQH